MNNKEAFVQRADEHIILANKQMSEKMITPGEASASFMYGLARFNAWVAATDFDSAQDMKDAKEEIIEYFTKEYKNLLAQHIDEHIDSFDFSNKK